MLFIKKQCAVILKNVMDDEMEELIIRQSLHAIAVKNVMTKIWSSLGRKVYSHIGKCHHKKWVDVKIDMHGKMEKSL